MRSQGIVADRSNPPQQSSLQLLARVVPTLPWCGGLVALVLDQLPKLHAENTYLISPPYPSMAHHRASSESVLVLATEASTWFFAFRATHVANAGLTLGVLEDAVHPVPWLVFMMASAGALGLAYWLHRRVPSTDVGLRCCAMVAAAGVVGNLIDRLRLGYVVDWIHLQWKGFGWFYDAPTFNLADLWILVGIALGAAIVGRRWLTGCARTQAPCTRA